MTDSGRQFNVRGVRFRVALSLVSNMIRVVVAFVTGVVIARLLGPASYGDFSFLVGSFAAFASLVDMGTSAAFFTFVSQRRQGLRFVAAYAGWLALQLVVLAALVLLMPDRLLATIWLGQPRTLILLALFSSFSTNQIWVFSGQLGESVRDTLGVQTRNLLAATLYLAIVVLLARLHVLSVSLLLLFNAVIYIGLAVAYAVTVHGKGSFQRGVPLNAKATLAAYLEYVYPTVVIGGFVYTFLDPWLLQRFSGSTQQGYYAVAFRFSSIALIITAAVIQVMWKEIAEAFAHDNLERVRRIEYLCARGLYFAAAVLACAVLPFIGEILRHTVGRAYLDATLPFAILMLYPMHQAMHTVYDTTLLAVSRAKTRSRIVAMFFVISIAMSYLLLAPAGAMVPGLQLGAFGLALKMVLCQVLQANVAAFFAARSTGARYDWAHQFVVLAVLLPLGFAMRGLAQAISTAAPLPYRLAFEASVSVTLYAAAVAVLLWRFPALAGVTAPQLRGAVRSFTGFFRTGLVTPA